MGVQLQQEGLHALPAALLILRHGYCFLLLTPKRENHVCELFWLVQSGANIEAPPIGGWNL